jgi:hypothetical protein
VLNAESSTATIKMIPPKDSESENVMKKKLLSGKISEDQISKNI